MTWRGGFINEVSTILPGSVGSTELADGSVTTPKVANVAITTAKIANLAVTDAKVNDLSADKLTAGTINTGNINVTSELTFGTNGRIQFTRGSTAIISTNDNPQNGDTWIEYRGNNAGAIIGLRKTGGAEIVTAQMNVTANGFEIATGQLDILSGIIDSGLGQDISLRISGNNKLIISDIAGGARVAFPDAADTYIEATRVSKTDTMHLHANDKILLSSASGGTLLHLLPPAGSGNVILDLNIERAWRFRQASTGSATRLELFSSSNKRFDIGGDSNGYPSIAVTTQTGGGSTLAIDRNITDVGNVTTLRANNGAAGTLVPIGWFSSWAKDPVTGRKRKRRIVDLRSKNKWWDRSWFMDLEPIKFERVKNQGKENPTNFVKRPIEFGFATENLIMHTNLLTTNGSEIGDSPHEVALLAIVVDYVQHLEHRLRELEKEAA